MATQRDEQRERSRGAILQAAAQLFADRGYTAASIGDIAAAVGQTKGAIYFHFPTKQQIAETIIQAYFDAWDAVTLTGGRGLEVLRGASRDVARSYQGDVIIRAAVRLMREASVIDTELPTPFVGWMSFVQSKLEEAREDGQLRQGIVLEHASWHIVATFFGVQEVSHQLSERSDLLERIDQMWDILLPGLIKHP